MLRLSKHFCNNWNLRVGGSPDLEEIGMILRQAVRVQKGRQITGRFSYIKTLTIYWHPDRNVIITVDHFRDTVVSVYSGENLPADLRIGDACREDAIGCRMMA